jgi:zinc transporter ZupT
MKPSAGLLQLSVVDGFHTFFDGVSIASAFLVNFKVGLACLYCHTSAKMPEGLL